MSTSQQEKITMLHEKLKSFDHHTKKSSTMVPQHPQMRSPIGQSSTFEETEVLNSMEAKYSSLEYKMNQIQHGEEKLLKILENEIQNLQEEQKAFRRDFQKGADRSDEDIHSVERAIHAEFHEMSQDLNSAKRTALDAMALKLKTIKTDSMMNISEQFQSNCKTTYFMQEFRQRQLESKLENLREKATYQQNTKQDAMEFIVSSFGEQIFKLQSALNEEKLTRQEKVNDLLKEVKEMEVRMTEQTKKERREMLQSKASIEGLLEDICYKIESKVLGV